MDGRGEITKEAEIIDSRADQKNPQQCPDDNEVGSAMASDDSVRLGREEIRAIVSLLENCTDTLTIYRSTLAAVVRRSSNGRRDLESVDRNERIIKLRDDSCYVSNLLEDLMNDVATRGCWNVLIREIEGNRTRQNKENTVARDYAEALERVSDLRERVRARTVSNEREIAELRAKLVRLKIERARAQIKVYIESRYVTAWERARSEGSSLRCGFALKRLEYTLGNLSSREKNERRVATEIEAFLEENVTMNERATTQWQKRYDGEMLMYESDNRRLRSEIESRTKAFEKLQNEYRERQEFIDTYVAEREAAAERRKLEEHHRGCAIKIQAWWRGVMVRRKLGPYRPDEKKKKRPAKSKK